MRNRTKEELSRFNRMGKKEKMRNAVKNYAQGRRIEAAEEALRTGNVTPQTVRRWLRAWDNTAAYLEPGGQTMNN